MRRALVAHDEVLRDTVAAHDGWLFKHTGDGVCAAFGSPRSAVDAAIAAQRALELPVRMGVATGEAELRGEDYFGTVLNRAARRDVGGPRRPDPGRRPHRADCSRALTSSRWAHGGCATSPGRSRCSRSKRRGCASEFPPLKTVDSTPGNLRPPTTQPDRPGIRTRRCGLRAQGTPAGDADRRRRGGQDAARVGGGGAVGARVPRRGVGDRAGGGRRSGGRARRGRRACWASPNKPGMTMADSVAAALEGRSRLLVFDNCEHVLDAAADMVEAILARSATVKVLATSREGLRVADEQLWPVPSLDTRTRIRLRGRDAVRRARRSRRRPVSSLDPVAGGGDLPPPRRDSVGDRVGRVADGVDDGDRGAGPPQRPVPAAGRVAARAGAPSDAAPRGAVVLRPAGSRTSRRCSTGARSSPAASTWRARVRWPAPTTSSPRWICLMPWCASRLWSPTDRRGEPGSRCWRRSGSSPKISSSPTGEADEARDCARALLRRTGSRCARPVGRSAAARGLRLVHRRDCRTCAPRSGGPPTSGDLDTAATIAVYAFIGGSGRTVRTHRMGRGTHRTREGRRTSEARSAVRGGMPVLLGRPDRRVRSAIAKRSAPHRRRALRRGSRSTARRVSAVRTYLPVSQNAGPTWLGVSSNTRRQPWTCPGVVGHGAGSRWRTRRGDGPDGRSR